MYSGGLPDGPWTAALIGPYWPAADALQVLDTGAEARRGAAAHFDDYADHLLSIRHTHLAGQEGSAAEAARTLFARGADRARATAERNGAKHRSYAAARHAVAALREELARIAEDGNTAIHRIQGSPIPAAAKVASIVEVIADAQTQARTRTAENAGHLLAEIQTVLDAHGADVSARVFAAAHGVDPAPLPAPCLDTLTHQVTARLESSAAPPAPGAGGSSTPPTESGRDAREHFPRGPADFAAALSTGAGALAAAAGSAIAASSAAASDNGSGPPAGGPGQPAVPAVPLAGTTITTAGTAPSSRPFSAAGAAPSGTGSPAPATTRAGGQAVAAPGQPGAATGLAQPGPATAAQSALLRRGAAMAAIPAVTTRGATERAATQRAVAVAARPHADDQLDSLVAAVARQRPELRWAVGRAADGGTVVATDLAAGWIPPGVEIPAGLRLLEPARRDGRPVDLLGDCASVATYAPGQQLCVDSVRAATSETARRVAAVSDLGWELTQTTRWRDGLPRLAHTLARAATAGTGWLAAEADLLGEHLDTVAAGVLAGYPDSIAGAEVGNWQLLATIQALLHGETADAAYHFAWFQATSPVPSGSRPPAGWESR